MISTLKTASIELWRHFLMLGVLGCFMALSGTAQPLDDLSETELRAQVEYLTDTAASYTDELSRVDGRIEEYLRLAREAEQQATTAPDPADIPDLRRSAGQFRRLASELANDREQVKRRRDRALAQLNSTNAALSLAEANAAISDAEDQSTEIYDRARTFETNAISTLPFEISLDQSVGVWRPLEDGDWPFVIVQAQPGSEEYPNRLEVHTQDRVWAGEYVGIERGHPSREHQARMKFYFTPSADEMNPEIPYWARLEIEGQLRWSLELDESGDALNPLLDVKLYPGEVQWDEKGNVSIIGPGSPNRFKLAQETHVSIEEGSVAKIWVELVQTKKQRNDKFKRLTNEPPVLNEQVDALLKHQTFTVKARIPPHQANELGDSITVNVETESGERTELTLLRRTPTGPRPAIFSLDKPISIADEGTEEDRNPPFASFAWFNSKFELDEGRRIRLDVDDREIVSFEFDLASHALIVYNKWYNRGMDQHHASATALSVFLLAKVLDGTATPADETALNRLANYASLMQQDDLHDLHKYNLGQLYVSGGLTGTTTAYSLQSQDPLQEFTFKPLYQVSDDELRTLITSIRFDPGEPQYMTVAIEAYYAALMGESAGSAAQRMADRVSWTSPYERQLVAGILQGTSHTIEETIEDTIGELAYGATKKVVEDFSIIFRGVDLKGKRKTDLDREVRATFLVFQFLLNQAPGTGMRVVNRNVTLPPLTSMQRLRNLQHTKIGPPRAYRFHQIKPRKHGPIQRVRLRNPATNNVANSTPNVGVMEQAGNLVVKDVPASLGVPQRRQLQQTLEADPPIGPPMECSRAAANKAPPRSARENDPFDGVDLGDLDLVTPPPAKGFDIGMTELQQRQMAVELYGPSVGFVEGQFPIYARQTVGDCQLHSGRSVLLAGGATTASRFELMQRAIEIERFVLAPKAMRAKNLRERAARGERLTAQEVKDSEWATLDPAVRREFEQLHKDPNTADFGKHLKHREENGIPNVTMRYLMREHGASVSTVRPTNNSKTRVSMVVDELDKGKQVRVGLDLARITKNPDDFHIVHVTGYRTLPNDPSTIVSIRFRESNLGGRELQLPLPVFESLIARKQADGLTVGHSNFESVSFPSQSTD